MPLDLSEKQKKVIGVALTTVSIVIVTAVVVAVLYFLLKFFTYFSGVFMPLAVAAILATLLKPFYDAVFSKVKNDGLSVAIVIIAIAAPLAVLGVYFGSKLVSQLTEFLQVLPVWIDNIQQYIQERLPELKQLAAKYEVRPRVKALLGGESGMLGDSSSLGTGIMTTGAFVFDKIAGLLGWVVMPVYFAYLIQTPVFNWKKLDENMPFFKKGTREDVVYLMSEFVGILVAFFRGQLIVALCQGLLFAIGFSLVGLPQGFVIGLALGFLNIIPYLGNIVGLAVAIPLAWFHPDGGLSVLIGAGVVFVIVQCIEGYVLTPRIMGQKTGLHPMAIIFAIFFWGTALNGLLGMILAIPLTAFLVVFWRLLRKNYIEEWL